MSAPAGARRRLTASQWFASAVVALVVVGVLGTVTSMIALHGLNTARVQLADRLSPAAITAADLRAALIDQETGVRGYALTGDDTFLEPFDDGRREAAAALAELERLSRLEGLRRLRGDVAAVAASARAWQSEYAGPTIAQVRSDPAAARSNAAIAAGKARFDAFRQAAARLQASVVPVRAAARDKLDRDAGVLEFWVLGTGLVVLLSVAAVALVLRGAIVRPLQRVAAGVRAVARGDFERAVAGSGAREVVDLAADVDAMRARIVAELDARAGGRG